VEQSHTAITAAGRTGTLPCDDQWLRYSYSDKPAIGIKEGEVRGAKYGKRNAFVYFQPLGHFYDLWRIFSYTCLLALTGAREELSSASRRSSITFDRGRFYAWKRGRIDNAGSSGDAVRQDQVRAVNSAKPARFQLAVFWLIAKLLTQAGFILILRNKVTGNFLRVSGAEVQCLAVLASWSFVCIAQEVRVGTMSLTQRVRSAWCGVSHIEIG
jgi:hypothetical protein